MLTDKEYFSHLYEIASHLNKEFSLPAALRKSLEKTVQLLHLETGWIWLVQGDTKSVYLAASYNLPPALNEHPERLSGWCYCIEKYLSDGISEARNISEIRCTRLKDIKTGTRDLKFHATIPITIKGVKVGLLNLVSKESQQLDDKQLSVLNTVSELMGMAVQRTRLQDIYMEGSSSSHDPTVEVIERVVFTRAQKLLSVLQETFSDMQNRNYSKLSENLSQSVHLTEDLIRQLSLIMGESVDKKDEYKQDAHFHYPSSSLTKRELEVLALVRKGKTNKQISEQLFIAERTVKFHISSILSKLYAHTRTEAVDTALQRGLLGPL